MATHLKTAEAAAERAEADIKVRSTVEGILTFIEARGEGFSVAAAPVRK